MCWSVSGSYDWDGLRCKMQSGEIIHQIFFHSEILREIFSVCVFASTQKQKSPLTHNFFTLTVFSKIKGTMDR